LAVGTLALVGLKTNINLALFVIGVIFLQAFSYSFNEFHHPEPPMIFTLSLLSLSPSGKVLSIDNLWRRRRLVFKSAKSEVSNTMDEKSTFARWPLLLSGWLLALKYLDSALSKLKHGLDWMNGYNLQYKLANTGVILDHDPAVWLSQQYALVWLMSWMTVLFEATFFLVLIFPTLALLYIPIGISFHIGLCVFMKACFWQWTAVYAVLIPWASILGILSWRQGFYNPQEAS
jgi:hypothetical protein